MPFKTDSRKKLQHRIIGSIGPIVFNDECCRRVRDTSRSVMVPSLDVLFRRSSITCECKRERARESERIRKRTRARARVSVRGLNQGWRGCEEDRPLKSDRRGVVSDIEDRAVGPRWSRVSRFFLVFSFLFVCFSPPPPYVLGSRRRPRSAPSNQRHRRHHHRG